MIANHFYSGHLFQGDPNVAATMLIEVLNVLRSAEAAQAMPYRYDPNTPIQAIQTYTSMTPPLDLRELITRVETVLNGGVKIEAEPEPPRLWITACDDNGVVFEGNEDHWRDCFFDNVSEDAIRDFCEGNGWTVTIA